MYVVHLQKFLGFIQKTPQQILRDYERMSERKFKVLYAQYLKSLIGSFKPRDMLLPLSQL